jgi:hypothetical protein
MAILNKDNFPYILSWGDPSKIENISIEYKKDGYPVFPCYNFDDADYWFVGILNGDALYHYPLKTLVPHDILVKIRQGEVKLVICNNHEPYHDIIDGIYKYVVMGANILPTSIVVLSSSYDLHKEVRCVSNKYNLGEIKAVYIREFEYDAQTYIKNIDKSILPKTLESKTYHKKFLSFNGLYRPHRASIVSLLSAYNVLDLGYVSYNSMPNQNLSTFNIYQDLLEYHKHNPEFLDLLTKQKDYIFNLQKISLDTDQDSHRDMAQYSKKPNHMYEETYFSIVTETVCFTRGSSAGFSGVGRLLSEKTFKPIIFKHPFVIAGVSGCVKQLKDLGYKTFSPYIDESYDDITDDSARILKIGKEVQRLASLSETQLQEFLEFCREITDYNYNHLLNLTDLHKKLN